MISCRLKCVIIGTYQQNQITGVLNPGSISVSPPNEVGAQVDVSVDKPRNAIGEFRYFRKYSVAKIVSLNSVGIETGSNRAFTSRAKRARVDVAVNVGSGCNDSVNGECGYFT